MPPATLRPTGAAGAADRVEHRLGGLGLGGAGLAGRGLEEVGAAVDREPARGGDRAESGSAPVSRTTFSVRPPSTMSRTAARRSRTGPVSPRRKAPVGQDAVDLVGAVADRLLGVVADPLEVVLALGEVHHRRDAHRRAAQEVARPHDELRPDADGGDRAMRRQRLPAERVEGGLGTGRGQIGEIEAAQDAAGDLGVRHRRSSRRRPGSGASSPRRRRRPSASSRHARAPRRQCRPPCW